MKKVGYLLLLTPALFLASCQTTPKIDTITEAEAREIISHFSGDFTPDITSKVIWNITKNDEVALSNISTYIVNEGSFTPEEGKKEAYITDTNRLKKYHDELTNLDTDFYAVSSDALIGMNDAIYNKLYRSLPFPDDPSNSGPLYNLKYKKNGDKGLVLIVESAKQNVIWTRTHVYNDSGREDRFEVNYSKDDVAYTMTIEFHYN